MTKKSANQQSLAKTSTIKKNWDLTPLFVNEKDPKIEETEQLALRASYAFINKWKEQKDYLSNPETLLEALTEYESWLKNYGCNSKVTYYFHLRTELDQNNPELKARFNKAKEVAIQIQNDIQFFTIKLAKISPSIQKKFLNEPRLATYHYFLKRLFVEAKYLLSEPEEKIANLYSETSYLNWVNLVSSLLSKEEYNGQNFAQILSAISNPDKKKRTKAFSIINKILAQHADVAEAELNSVLGYKKVSDDLRQTPRPDFLRHLSDDISSQTVDSLIDAVSSRFDIPQRYYQLKAKILGFKKIKYYEKNIPIGKTNKKYSYEKSVGLVHDVLGQLDKDLQNIFDDFIKKGQIDALPKLNKTDGAFCTHMRSIDPTYILLNHTNQLRDVLTLAHETGHGINNELIKRKHGEIYFDTPISTAEVASTFLEDFVLEKLSKQNDKKFALALKMSKLDDDISSIFRQVSAYRFEQELHERYRRQGYLSKKEIGELFLKHMKNYTGPSMDYPAGTENWWIYWSHFRNFFYVYSYASGLLISKTLQGKVRQNPIFINSVKEFLTTGTSIAPEKAFQNLGIEISDKNFWLDGLKEIDLLLTETEKLYSNLKN